MNRFSKKTVAALVVGAFILAGVAAPFIVQAAEKESRRTVKTHRQVDPIKAADRLSAVYGVSKISVLKHHAGGVSYRDLHRASFLAMASGKSLNDVLALKERDNTWKQVSATLELTEEQIKTARKTAFSNRMNLRFNIDKQAVFDLLEQGQKPRDIATAGWLAQKSGKTINEVIALKSGDKQWADIAQELGVSKAAFKKHNRHVQHSAHHKRQNSRLE